MPCFVMLSLFWQPLCWFVQPWFPMRRWLAVVAAVAAVSVGAAASMEVALASMVVRGTVTCPVPLHDTL